MRHSEIPNYARSSSSAHQRCLLQVRSRRHRTPQIFRSQFETKVHNQIRKRVENYVENRSSHVRNPVFYEQICDELLSGFTMIARLGQAERNELLERGDTPEEGGRRVDRRYQTSLATSDRCHQGIEGALQHPKPKHPTTKFGPQPLDQDLQQISS